MSKLATAVNFKELYAPGRTQPSIVEVPKLKFLMVDGMGDPNTSADFQGAIQALFTLSWGIHFALKGAGVDSHVRPLEALWWSDRDLVQGNASKWHWTAMMLQPDEITGEILDEALAEARRKRSIPALDKVRLESFHEGLSAQVMHVGPYSAEKPTIERLRAFIAAAGYRPRGKHHEIYIGDPRRAAPEKLKTVIRLPIVR